MRVSYRWLKKFLNFDLSAESLVNLLVSSGMEIGEIIDLGYGGEPIVVAEVREAAPHAAAPHLTVCKMTTGSGSLRQIVSGARDIQTGERAPLALPGARLASGLTVSETLINGEETEGVLCTGAEIGWSADDSSPLWLPKDYALGEPVDFLIELSPPPNRPDCLSIFGLAREIAAQHKRKVYAKAVRFTESLEHAESFVAVTVPERDLCPRYSGRFFRDLRVGHSPLWLRRALESAGISPVNNVVDTVNYILTEMGQPVQAYDADKIANRQIAVRLAKDGESLRLPDGGQVDLEKSDLVLVDAVKVIGLAGIAVSQDVSITDATCNVFLECSIFNSATVRRTTERLKMASISSYLHECGVDRGLQTQALNNAAFMIKEFCGGEVAKGAIEISAGSQQIPPVGFSLSECNRLLGLNLKGREAADILVALGFEILHFDHDLMMVRPPTHRIDVTCDSDLIEEVARLHGYDKLPATMPYLRARSAEIAPEAKMQRRARDLMVSLGFSEIICDSFISRQAMEQFSIAPERCIQLENPVALDRAALRPSLAPSIVSALKHNLQGGENDLRLFEVAPVFRKGEAADVREESIHLAAGMCGARSWHWRERRGEVDFFDLKGISERILAALRAPDCRYVADAPPFLHPGRAASIMAGGRKIGWLGELHPNVCEKHGQTARTYLLELNLKACIPHLSHRPVFENRPRFPALERQLNVIISLKMLSEEVIETIRATAADFLESCDVIDHHRGAPAPTGKKSLSYRLIYRAPDRILRESDVDALQDKIAEALQTELGARLLE